MEEKIINSKLLILPGYLAGIGCLIFMTQRTLLAFFSDQKAVTIYINRYGEQYLDLVSLIILWMISLIGLFLLLAYMKKDREPQSYANKRKSSLPNERPYQGLLNESLGDTRREAPSIVYANMTTVDDQPTDEHLLFSSHRNKTVDNGNIIKK